MKIRQQHYVWRHYLEAWEVEGQLSTLRAGRIFRTSAAGVAKRRDFYRLKVLTPRQIELVRVLAIASSPPVLRDMHEKLLDTFASLPLLHERAQALPEGHEARRLADEALINTEENLHSRIERAGSAHLRDLRRMDTGFFETEDGATDFLYFLCTQYLRTQSIQRRIGAALRASPLETVGLAAPDVERIWPILRHIYAVNASFSLFRDRRHHRIVLLTAPEERPLITGDQPVVNALGTWPALTPPEEFEPYYPIGPRLGMLLTSRDIHPRNRAALSVQEAVAYNDMVRAASDEMIFAASEAELEPYR